MSASATLLLQHSELLSNFIGSFQELRTGEELFDVTLACGDKTLEAHKVVLSACSPFFRQVFSMTKQNHPFVYLKDIMFKDLKRKNEAIVKYTVLFKSQQYKQICKGKPNEIV